DRGDVPRHAVQKDIPLFATCLLYPMADSIDTKAVATQMKTALLVGRADFHPGLVRSRFLTYGTVIVSWARATKNSRAARDLRMRSMTFFESSPSGSMWPDMNCSNSTSMFGLSAPEMSLDACWPISTA